MIFDRNENKAVSVLLGAGSMGTAILRRVCAGTKILFGDISEKKLVEIKKEYQGYGYDVETQIVDANSKNSIEDFAKKAASLGDIKYYIHTAGASPNQASAEKIIKLDLIGSAYALDAFGKVIAGFDAIKAIEEKEVVADQASGKLQKNLVLKKALVDLKGKEYPEVEKISE